MRARAGGLAGLSPRGPKAAFAALGLCEIVIGDEGRPLDALKKELGHPVPRRDAEGLPSVVHQNDPDLAPVVAVDDAGKGVDSVAHGQPAPGPDEPDVARRELQLEPRGDGVAVSWQDLDRFARPKIGPCRVRRPVRRQCPAVVDGGGNRQGVTTRRRLRCRPVHDADTTPERLEDAVYHRRMSRPNLFGMEPSALTEVVDDLGEPGFRARQIQGWLYARRARRFAEMLELPKALRARLEERFSLKWPDVAERTLSFDGTRKYLFRLDDGATIEAVYIPEDNRRTICISTQAGCPLKCAFCLTGIAGYKRNLTTGEILGQVATVMEEHPSSATHPERREEDPFPWNVVIMGMGEPLLNYDATVAALRILMDEDGFAIPARKLTLSTVGILPALARLVEDGVHPNLAISLHAPDPGLRRALMPIEEKYSLDDVLKAALAYPIPRGGRVTFEYVLLHGVNDTPAHARELARRLRGRRVKVNLIPLNPAPEIPFEAPSPEDVDGFCAVLAAASVTVSVRRPRGRDILAACGQLHLKGTEASVRG